jgi:hypothetical protein
MLVYHFEEIQEFNRVERESGNSSFIEDSAEIQTVSSRQTVGYEIRKKIVFMLGVIKSLMEEGVITDFSILRSSLHQVFKKVVRENTSLE